MTFPSSSSSLPSSSVESSVSQMNTQAIRWLCEGRSNEAFRLLDKCLGKVKQHMPQVIPQGGDVKTKATTTTTYTTQVYVTEIPMDGAIGDGIYNAPKRDTSFHLYQCALLVSPIQDQQDREEAFRLWVQAQEEQEKQATTIIKEPSSDLVGGSTSKKNSDTELSHAYDWPEQELEDVYEEPWNARTWYLFSGIVRYNLGLVYHILGLEQGCMPLLARARCLYRTSAVLVQRMAKRGRIMSPHKTKEKIMVTRRVTVAPDAPSQWLACAVYNNLGHLAAFWGDMATVINAHFALQVNYRCGPCAARMPPLFRDSLVQARRTRIHCNPAAAA